MRVLSLLSSATETVCAMGLEKSLVGISHECDFPTSIRALPVASTAQLNPNLPAGEIHGQIQDLMARGLSPYRVSPDVLEALKPDLILTQHQCEVCAVSFKDVEEAVKAVTKKDTRVLSLHPFALDDICKTFRQIGEAMGAKDAAEKLVTEFWIRLNQVNARAGTHVKQRPKVLLIEWLDPLIISGSWIPEAAVLAGADPQVISGPEHFKKMEWRELEKVSAEKILVLPCGWNLERTVEEMDSPRVKPQLSRLSQTLKAPVFACDGNSYFNRPGPRIADTIEIMAAIIYPEKFPDFVKQFEGKAYRRWTP